MTKSKEIYISFGVDVDAVAGWLGSYGGQDSPDDISRGMFAREVGVSRLLRLFERHDIKASWFTPGHSIETFPAQMQAVADAGHEIGLHGYSHENPIAMTPAQEEVVLRVGDSWTNIDYGQHPDAWMKPLRRGVETDLVEIPASWYLDDLPPMMFIKKSSNSHGFVNPRDVEQMWRDQFDWVYRELDYAVFPMTLHPDVSGHPQVLLMLERLIRHFSAFPGVRFATYDQVADDFLRRQPRV